MKTNDPKELIAKARQAPKVPKPEVPEMPHGFAHRVVANLPENEGASKLKLFEWVSYGGVGVAACVVAIVSLQTSQPEATNELAVDPWLEMPESSDY